MANSYTTKGLAPPPRISMTTMPMAGLMVDVYGLEELPADGDAPVTCLWLLHPRMRTRAYMQDIACRVLAAWNARIQEGSGVEGTADTHKKEGGQQRRSLLALAFDMPNHGSRLVSKEANRSWDRGNASHAIDMAGAIRGACLDLSLLMDLGGAYLGRRIDAHVALGWSLGGHAAWQAVMGEKRLDAAVVVVGCPDYSALLIDRARRSGLAEPVLLGSSSFPNSLLAALAACDPAAVLFGIENGAPCVPRGSLDAEERTRLRGVLDGRLRGKRILCCSGGEDTLTPYKVGSEAVLAVLGDAVREGGWYADGGVVLEDRVYEGAGHEFRADMVRDAVEFLVRAVAAGPRA